MAGITGNDLWRKWIRDNSELFASLNSSAKIGFLAMDIFESTEGKAIILIKEGKGVVIKEQNFTGLRVLPVDIIFIAPQAILEKIIKEDCNANKHKFYHSIRRKEVLFFILATTSELEEKGYADFLESIGLEFLGACVG